MNFESLTIKHLLKIFGFIVLIMAFCPSFLVSCYGSAMEIGVPKALTGIVVYGETIVKPQLELIILIAIPVAILVLLFWKKFTDDKTNKIVLACTAVDFIIWIVFACVAGDMAEKNYCEFKLTMWFCLDMLILVFILVITTLVLTKKLSYDTKLSSLFSNISMPANTNLITSPTMNPEIIGYCQSCGNPIKKGYLFCQKCGEKVPESLLVAPKKEEQQVHVCLNCGAKLDKEDIFCPSCGTKVQK